MSSDLPSTMPAVVLAGPDAVDVVEVEVPRPAPDQVILEVAACGICGSDLHLTLDGWGAPGTIPGHEFAGTVVALGSEAQGVAVGDVVTPNMQVGCGQCDGCDRGRPSVCRRLDLIGTSWMGGFARFAAAPTAGLHALPPEVTLEVAALVEPLAVALHAVTQARLEPDSRALITGGGPLGLLCITALRARGVAQIVVSEPSELRREQARLAGADVVMHPEDVPDPIIPTLLADDPFDIALECSGNPAGTAAALRNLRPGGRLVIVGAGLAPVPMDMTRVMIQELEVAGTINYDEGGFEEAIGMLADDALALDVMCEEELLPLDRYLDACRALAGGEIARKVRIDPRLPI